MQYCILSCSECSALFPSKEKKKKEKRLKRNKQSLLYFAYSVLYISPVSSSLHAEAALFTGMFWMPIKTSDERF